MLYHHKAYINNSSTFLTKKTNVENKILDLFLYSHKLKFNEIEKKLGIRSNKLAYHLKDLIKKGILAKENDFYLLTETSEYLIPYLSSKKPVLPVILVHIGNKEFCFLHKREKRPFKNYLSLPGGRLILGETITQATSRIMKKYNIKAKFKKINSIFLEHVKKKGKIIHSFLLIFVSAETKSPVNLTNVKENKNKIISSDYKLITSEDSEIKIETVISKVNN